MNNWHAKAVAMGTTPFGWIKVVAPLQAANDEKVQDRDKIPPLFTL